MGPMIVNKFIEITSSLVTLQNTLKVNVMYNKSTISSQQRINFFYVLLPTKEYDNTKMVCNPTR
jgi:hypothetical protein